MWLLLKLCKGFLGMDWVMKIEFPAEVYDYLFVTSFIPTLVHTQPPIQWVAGTHFPKGEVAREWNSLSQRISSFLIYIKNCFCHLKTLRFCSIRECVGKWPVQQLVLSGPWLMNTTVIFSWISGRRQHWSSHQIQLDNPSIFPKKPPHSDRIKREVEEFMDRVVDATHPFSEALEGGSL
jgi:hypothetical protein